MCARRRHRVSGLTVIRVEDWACRGSTWPPNPCASPTAASRRSVWSWRERKRAKSAAVSTSAGTASSIAALNGPAALAGILDDSRNSRRAFGPRPAQMAVRSSSQDETTLPRRQTSAMSARSRSKRSSSGSAVAAGVLQDVEALGIGLHQAVLDAVVDHLDEMAGAAGPGMEIALLDARIAAVAARRARDVAEPGRQRREDRIEPVDRRPCRRRSSCNSRARGPRRRRGCRHRR